MDQSWSARQRCRRRRHLPEGVIEDSIAFLLECSKETLDPAASQLDDGSAVCRAPLEAVADLLSWRRLDVV